MLIFRVIRLTESLREEWLHRSLIAPPLSPLFNNFHFSLSHFLSKRHCLQLAGIEKVRYHTLSVANQIWERSKIEENDQKRKYSLVYGNVHHKFRKLPLTYKPSLLLEHYFKGSNTPTFYPTWNLFIVHDGHYTRIWIPS